MLRHSFTRKDRRPDDTSSHLSAAGGWRARGMGEGLPDFNYVAVGDQPRHLETALALGFAVDEQISWPSGYVEGVVAHHDQWSWPQPFVRYAELVRGSSALPRWLRRTSATGTGCLVCCRKEAQPLSFRPAGQSSPFFLAALPDADHASWGSAFHQLEGARLGWDGDGFYAPQLLRQDAAAA